MAKLLVPLDKHHDVKSFNCGEEELNNWLQKFARQHQVRDISRTFVYADEGEPNVIMGFYCFTICEVRGAEAPSNLGKKYPNKIPAMRLARLATDLKYQGNKTLRVGETLLLEAMSAAKELSRKAGGVALFVDAKHLKAAAFYKKYGFIEFEDDPMKLFMRTDTIPD